MREHRKVYVILTDSTSLTTRHLGHTKAADSTSCRNRALVMCFQFLEVRTVV
jgi:hypothetical protein